MNSWVNGDGKRRKQMEREWMMTQGRESYELEGCVYREMKELSRKVIGW